MLNRFFLFFFLVLSSPSLLWADKPNILMIVGDDWGWNDFGFMGSKVVQTPHLDKLAQQAAVFPNGYVPTSLCRASLATILTGQYAHQHKICCNDPPEGVDRAEMLPFLKNSPTIPRLLKESGYKSFQTGKFWEGHYSNGGFTEGMTTKGRHGEEGLVIGRKDLKPIYEFLDKYPKDPWFIWYAPMMPHLPHNPPEAILKKYQIAGRDERLAKYYAMCEWTDQTVGELMAELAKRKLLENTLVVFVVDNGWVQATGPVKANDQFLTRSKNTPYDKGVRTPIFFWWPQRIKPATYPDLVSTVDLAPTILQATGTNIPKEMAGVSLLNLLEGKEKLKRDTIFGEIYLHTAKVLDKPAINLTHRWVRSGKWKLIVPLSKEGKPELYDLSTDPEETKNLAEENPKIVEELREKLKTSWDSWKELN